MSASAVARILPCPQCGAESGDPCITSDGRPRSQSHTNRTPVQPCGTYGGYQAHKKRGEAACDECRDASRRYMAEYRRKHPEVRDADIAGLDARREATRLLIQRHEAEFRQLLKDVKETA